MICGSRLVGGCPGSAWRVSDNGPKTTANNRIHGASRCADRARQPQHLISNGRRVYDAGAWCQLFGCVLSVEQSSSLVNFGPYFDRCTAWCEAGQTCTRLLAEGQAGFVANMSDIAPRQSGKLFGICNTFGTAAGIAGVAGAGYVVQLSGSFVPVFQLTAVLYVMATIAWNLMCTGEQVFT